MKFDISNYPGRYVMHCRTEVEAIDFCDYLNSLGRTNCLRRSYSGESLWSTYKDTLTINFNEGTQCNIEYYLKANFTILEWSDFMNKTFTKTDLKTGDVVLRRNGHVGIANLELGMFIGKDGWTDFNCLRNDLTASIGGEGWDIIAVRRPIEKHHCQFTAFDKKLGTLIYERKEVEEMTLEQVCKLLGKEIKIIK